MTFRSWLLPTNAIWKTNAKWASVFIFSSSQPQSLVSQDWNEHFRQCSCISCVWKGADGNGSCCRVCWTLALHLVFLFPAGHLPCFLLLCSSLQTPASKMCYTKIKQSLCYSLIKKKKLKEGKKKKKKAGIDFSYLHKIESDFLIDLVKQHFFFTVTVLAAGTSHWPQSDIRKDI